MPARAASAGAGPAWPRAASASMPLAAVGVRLESRLRRPCVLPARPAEIVVTGQEGRAFLMKLRKPADIRLVQGGWVGGWAVHAKWGRQADISQQLASALARLPAAPVGCWLVRVAHTPPAPAARTSAPALPALHAVQSASCCPSGWTSS